MMSRIQVYFPIEEGVLVYSHPRYTKLTVGTVLQRLALGACRTWSTDSENRPQRGQFLPDLQSNSRAIGQKDGEKWAAAVDLQPTISKSDRLLEMLFAEKKHKFFDFTEGESEHKKLFATSHRQCADEFFIRRSFAHWLLAQGHRNFNAAMETSCAFFERHRWQTRIRQWLRFGR